MSQAFHRAVVQVYVAHLQPVFQCVGVGGVAVVLGGDMDTPVGKVADRMVGSAVPELQLESTGAKSPGD